MTLAERVSFVVLSTYPPLENQNVGVPSLCIRPLSLSDGPMVSRMTHRVTAFPRSWDSRRASTFARARRGRSDCHSPHQGITVMQGPELNLLREPSTAAVSKPTAKILPRERARRGRRARHPVDGVMAEAKHFGATPRDARARLTRSSRPGHSPNLRRAVPCGRAAGTRGGIMSPTEAQRVDTCANPYIYSTLRSWHFAGFVRSDQARRTASPPPFEPDLTGEAGVVASTSTKRDFATVVHQ